MMDAADIARDSAALAEWCRQNAPRREKSDLDLAVLTDGVCTAISLRGDQTGDARAYEMGCLQDAVWAALVAEGAAKGELDPAARIDRFLPELQNVAGKDRAIRLGHLLSHSSGFWFADSAAAGATNADWAAMCEWIRSTPTTFLPGTVVNYTLIERVLLVKLLERHFGRSVYDLLLRDLSADLPELTLATPNLLDRTGLREVICDVGAFAQLLNRLLERHPCWIADAQAERGAARCAIAHLARGKRLVPLAATWGLTDLGCGVFGRSGHGDAGFVGFRFDVARKYVIVGAFAAKFERDVTLNKLCRALGFYEDNLGSDRIIGDIGDFAPEELEGVYFGALGKVRLTIRGPRIIFATTDNKRGLIAGTLRNGVFHSDMPMPCFWFEPFLAPGDSAPSLMVGQVVYRRSG